MSLFNAIFYAESICSILSIYLAAMDDECHRIPIEKTVVGDDDDLPELIDGDVGQSSQPVSAVNIQSKAASKQLDADGFVEPTSKGRKRKHRGDATNSAMDVDVVADVQVERAAKRKRFQVRNVTALP